MSQTNFSPDPKPGANAGGRPLLATFKAAIQQDFPYLLRLVGPQKQIRPVLLAISGGMDSMVLARLLAESGIPAIWVHCNFQLRGQQSLRDENFVRDQAAAQQVPLVVQSFDTEKCARQWKMSIEETARKLRYDLFAKLLSGQQPLSLTQQSLKPQYLMTAHHAADNIETLLLNFFRGTGISGLHGMPPKNGNILRPLLNIKKQDLINYAHQTSLQWVEDSTNQLSDYTRNYLRNEILPALKKQYPYIEDTLVGNIQRFTQAELLYKKGLKHYQKRLFNFINGQLHLSVLFLLKTGIATTLLWEALKSYGFSSSQIPEVEKLLFATTGAYQDNPSGTYRVLRNRAHLVVTALASQQAAVVVIEPGQQHVDFPGGRLDFKAQVQSATAPLKIQPALALAQLDSAKLSFPLLLRKWQPGDYFYPLGMRKKKKVARFLIDQKLALHEKEQVWVLESQQRIVWVVGLRIDDRFKITAKTNHVLKVQYRKS